MSELFLPHDWLDEGWWRAYRRLAAALADPPAADESGATGAPPTPGREATAPQGVTEALAAYAELSRELVAAAHEDLAAAIADALVRGEAPFAVAEGGEAPSGARRLLHRDLESLCRVARADLAEAVSAVSRRDVEALSGLAAPSSFEPVRELREALLSDSPGEVTSRYLDGLREHGGGLASVNGALRWRGGALQAVTTPAAASFDDLIGLDDQLARLRTNTESLVAGHGAHNVLLYGPRGSGKSTAVRALLTHYQAAGLRLVELPLEELTDLPELLERLRGRPQAFVLFVDDLAFEEGDTSYRPLRTLLEGGLAGRPENVALYATSNRRHLLKERFRDRPDPLDDDVHRWDSQHEKLALADRFGLTITFPDAGQRRYLEVVRGLYERQHGSERGGRRDVLGGASLEEAAIRFAEWGNGYSGRTAAQFIASLASRAAAQDDAPVAGT